MEQFKYVDAFQKMKFLFENESRYKIIIIYFSLLKNISLQNQIKIYLISLFLSSKFIKDS